jgi:predicted membrane protein
MKVAALVFVLPFVLLFDLLAFIFGALCMFIGAVMLVEQTSWPFSQVLLRSLTEEMSRDRWLEKQQRRLELDQRRLDLREREMQILERQLETH